MTIDIIANARADRQSRLDQILKLQLDVIEIDQFIAKAESYAEQDNSDTTAPMPLPEGEANSSPDLETPAEAKTVDKEPSTDGSGGVQDECAIHPAAHITEPQPSAAQSVQASGPETSTLDGGRADETPVADTQEGTTSDPSETGQEVAVEGDLGTTSGKPKAKRDVISDVHEAHPDWSAHKIADETGIGLSTVRRYASTLGIRLPARSGDEPKPKRAFEKVLEAHIANPEFGPKDLASITGLPRATVGGYLGWARQEAAKQRGDAKPQPAQEPKKEAPAPSAPAEPLPTAREPLPAPAPPSARARPAAQPSGTKFRLVHPVSGLYLHESISRDSSGDLQVTAYREFAWCQPESKLLNVRKAHPDTLDWREEVVL